MDTEVLVSIIIPVYNVEKYLEECLNSAINQSFNSIEIIAVNDGSTDRSLDILKRYAQQYENIIIFNQENGGQSSARNTGLKYAKGKYVYFLDSDDYINLDMIKECYELAEANQLDIINFDAQVVYENGFETNFTPDYNRSKKIDSNVYNGEDFYCYLMNNNAYKVSVCLSFYKRDLFKNFNLSFYEGIIHEDDLFYTKALLAASKVLYIPNAYFYRRVREGSTMTKAKSLKNIEGYLVVADELYKVSKKINNSETKDILNQQILNCYNSCLGLSVLVFDEKKELINQVNQIRKNILSKYSISRINKKLLLKLIFLRIYVNYLKIRIDC